MRIVIIYFALFLASCGYSSVPVQPAEYLAASLACEPHGGLAAVKVDRMNKITDITAQCASGVVIEYLKPAPKPATPVAKTEWRGA